MVTDVAVDLKREFWWKVWIYNVLCLPLLLPWGEPACISLSVREFQRARVSVLKRPCLWTQKTHVQVCKCLCARVCDCEHHCVRRPPLGISPHPSTSHCLMSGSDTCCLSLPILSQTTKSHQNPGKDCKTHSFKNKWKILLFVGGFFRTHSLLRLITPRIGIGKVCQDEDGDV